MGLSFPKETKGPPKGLLQLEHSGFLGFIAASG